MRITLTRGECEGEWWELKCKSPTLIITAKEHKPVFRNYYQQGIKAIIAGHRHLTFENFKTTNYLASILARNRALLSGNQEAIFLDIHGYLSEAIASNLFFVKHGQLYTPSKDCGILPGITRELVVELTRKEGITVNEGCYFPDKLLVLEEAFLTNSVVELLLLTIVNGQNIGQGYPGEMTSILRKSYCDLVDKVIKEG